MAFLYQPAIILTKACISEHQFLSCLFNLFVLLEHQAVQAKIAEQKKYQLAILDDGLQDKSLNYDISIVCFNSSELMGNGLVLPAGPFSSSRA